MKPFRLVFIGVAVVVGVLLVAAGILFNSSFQTWAVRKALANHPDLRVTVGSVDAGWRQVKLKDVRVEENGATITLPSVDAELSVFAAALGEKVDITRLVAKGWTVDLSAPASASASVSASVSTAQPTPSAADAAAETARAFAGIFSLLELPFDFALSGVDLEGDVVLPDARGRGKVTLAGGGVGAGREGTFEAVAHATFSDRKIDAIEFAGRITAAMASPRAFSRVAARFDAIARGEQLANAIKLTSDIVAERTTEGERYSASVTNRDRTLVAIDATLPKSSGQLNGTWRIDLADTSLAPFAFGRGLPTFSAVGEGSFETNVAFDSIRAQGKLEADADRLSVIKPELSKLGQIRLLAEFDLAQRGRSVVVDQLNASLASEDRPVATARALQAFSLDLSTRKLVAADPAKELFGLTLEGVPLVWAQPLLPALEIDGGDIRGQLVATPRGGGMNVRSSSPLVISSTSVARAGQPLVRNVAVSFLLGADYAPQGWQGEIVDLKASSGDATIVAVDAKAGQLAGAAQPIKTTGKLVANLAALAAQPLGAKFVALTAGRGTVDFAASLGDTRELQATIALSGLATDAKTAAGKLPALTTDLRADIGRDGRITLNLPVRIEGEKQKSDVTIAGTVTRGTDALTIDAQLTSTNLAIDDAKVFAAVLGGDAETAATTAQPSDSSPTTTAPADRAPVWAGVNGTLALALKRVVYAGGFLATDVTGTLRLTDGAVKLEGVRTGLGERGGATLDGTLSFEPNATKPYLLAGELTVSDFDPGPMFRVWNANQAPTLEGLFHVTSRVTARSATLGGLPANVRGDFQLSSRGGVFRGLPVNVASIAENTGTIAALIASAGAALNEIRGRKEPSEAVSKAQAVSDLAKRLSAISYDQVNLVFSRDASLETTIKEFTLISPEVRLSGAGRLATQAGGGWLDQRVSMEFKLRARDQLANLLRRIGRLESESDELGYFACTLPLKVNGTLGKPQTGELNRALVAIALERAGAADFVERILGK